MKRLAVALLTVLMVAGCSQTGDDADPQAPGADPVTVFAAASLQDAFPEISDQAGIQASYSFDGSSGLVDQISGGAPADVFASADQRNMDKAVELGLIEGDPQMFATNPLVLVVPAGNPGGVTGFDSSLDGVKLVVCAEEVPCGGATVKVAEKAGLTLNPVSEESKVTDVLGKVTSGEADAGIVYATDAAAAGDEVEVFEIPGSKDEPNTYWIAVVKGAANPEGAARYIEAVTTDTTILSRYGFGPPQQ